MRRLFVLGSAVLAAFVACTVSEENLPSNVEPEAGPSDASLGRDVAFTSDAIEEERDASCSDEGWCKTALPSQSLIIRDIWPFEDRAFALAESYTLGIRVMEWTAAASKWEYIDDNAPNDVAAEYATRIWAPNPNEIYVALAPLAIYHGVRGEEGWSWKIETIANAPAAPTDIYAAYTKDRTLGVWGTGSEVYAWYVNSLYRRSPSGEWVREYIAEDNDSPDELMLFMGAAGISADDIWFSGVRFNMGYSCTFLVRKAAGGYQRIADATLRLHSRCLPRPGFPLLDSNELPTALQSRDGRNFFLVNSYRSSIYRIAQDDGGIDASLVTVPRALIDDPMWGALWAESNDRMWLGGSPGGGSGWGVLLRGDDVWDGGKFEYSSTAAGGVPLHQRPNQIRGTSTANIWVVGEGYALHKTTP